MITRLNLATMTAATALCSMATDALAAGGGTPPATLGTDTPTPPAAEANPNVLTFRIPNTETDIAVDLTTVPPEVRLDFLKKGLKDYIVNSVNQTNMRAKKANEPFDAYDEAMKADPLQSAVKKPDGERTTPDLLGTAAAARERLYKGEVRKQDGEPGGRKRETRDPLIKMVTDAVVRELHDKKKTTVQGYKFTDAVKEVGSDGVAYLNRMIDEKVAAGADRATLEKFRDERYIKPAEQMLGRRDNKATKDQSLLG